MFDVPVAESTNGYQKNYSGISITGGTEVVLGASNVDGAWVDLLGTTTTANTYGITIHLYNNSISNSSRPTIVDIGIDRAGGTSYSSYLVDLNACDAAPYNSASNLYVGGIWYYFPIFIPSGSTVAARGRVDHVTADGVTCAIKLHQGLTHPHLTRVGYYCDPVGVVATSSRGTEVVPGVNGAKGAWTLLGTVPRDAFWIQASLSIDDSTLVGQAHFLDIAVGDSLSKRIILNNVRFGSSSVERISGMLRASLDCYVNLKAGNEIYARIGNSGATADTLTCAMVYLVGP